MKSYLMELSTIGPLHIGSGRKIGKKEYIYQAQKGMVLIPDEIAMYSGLQKMGLERKFQDYLLTDNRTDLGKWLSLNRVTPEVYKKWIKYTLAGGDHLSGGRTQIEIMQFQKDNYGLPYVPGTSIKGLLRTLLLVKELVDRPENYSSERNNLLLNVSRPANAKVYLKRDVSSLEDHAFHTLERHDERGREIKRNDAVNDNLSGLIVSDSEPLGLDDLVLCKKVEQAVDGNARHSINILRESIKPGKTIKFHLTINEAICPYGIEDIIDAVNVFGDVYYSVFLSGFKGTDRPMKNTVWLGGGTGFVTKTVVYPLLGKQKGLQATVDIFDHTVNQRMREQHQHHLDIRKGVSPHILKCTEYQGKTYQMGMCKMSIGEELL